MKIIQAPQRHQWESICKRPVHDTSTIFATVSEIINKVKNEGDNAIRYYSKKFDGTNTACLLASNSEIENASSLVPEQLKQAIKQAKENIAVFHREQLGSFKKIETTQGVICWQKQLPIEKIGLYIPGGSAPLFSTVLMLAVPAKIAGCKEIILCTPPDKTGNINPVILYTAQAAGVDKIYKIGGAQAIAAMACGTESIPKVYKIFGPGNQYVTAAKQLVSMHNTAIDMPAGPSEVEILADQTAIPKFVAADMLSQAEHGTDSQALLVTTSKEIAYAVAAEVELQSKTLSRQEIIKHSLENCKIIIFDDMQQAITFTNEYAPEHLILSVENDEKVGESITNAGSIFLGNFTPESAGDYASGTNHTLPTNGYAKMYNGVNIDSFMRKITFQKISQKGLENIGQTIKIMAQAEGLQAHKKAVTIRLDNKDND